MTNSSVTLCHHWSEQTGATATGFGVLTTRMPACPWCVIEQLHAAVKTAQELAATRLMDVGRLTRERHEYKIWWERDSTSLGKALNEVSSLRAGNEQFRAQIVQLTRDMSALQSQWDDMQQGFVEVFGEPVRDAIELLGATERLRSAHEPSEQYVHVGNVFGKDAEGDVLVDWDSEEHAPEPGTILFVRLWTQAELDEADKRADERMAQLATSEGASRDASSTREEVEQRAMELRETGVKLIPNSWRCQHGTVYAWPIAVAVCGCDRDSQRT